MESIRLSIMAAPFDPPARFAVPAAAASGPPARRIREGARARRRGGIRGVVPRPVPPPAPPRPLFLRLVAWSSGRTCGEVPGPGGRWATTRALCGSSGPRGEAGPVRSRPEVRCRGRSLPRRARRGPTPHPGLVPGAEGAGAVREPGPGFCGRSRTREIRAAPAPAQPRLRPPKRSAS
ncbi:hypothetical protein GCM10010421_05890 [Streptomyces glaucus]|uniref:Secreted protein n=1 Tax=Streptomyces glaucus TaxID=284029 RepID=A0ABN3J5N3_9ACTN